MPHGHSVGACRAKFFLVGASARAGCSWMCVTRRGSAAAMRTACERRATQSRVHPVRRPRSQAARVSTPVETLSTFHEHQNVQGGAVSSNTRHRRFAAPLHVLRPRSPSHAKRRAAWVESKSCKCHVAACPGTSLGGSGGGPSTPSTTRTAAHPSLAASCATLDEGSAKISITTQRSRASGGASPVRVSRVLREGLRFFGVPARPARLASRAPLLPPCDPLTLRETPGRPGFRPARTAATPRCALRCAC